MLRLGTEANTFTADVTVTLNANADPHNSEQQGAKRGYFRGIDSIRSGG